ncbi:MAG TPA: N-acetylmannosamine-6-phosphate 2-epimerase [Ruminiclostridium sp.]
MKNDFIVTRGLIVSCQALAGEPLYGCGIMPRMALAAKSGGAVGLRVNGVEDIRDIKKVCNLPVIGIIKASYQGFDVYITPSMKEVEALVKVKADIIAVDATMRPRPGFDNPEQFISEIKKRFKVVIMADVSTYEEGINAYNAGADVVSTTLSSYTPYTSERDKPDLDLIRRLVDKIDIPVIAEGNIQTPEQALECLEAGAHAVVVGGAITRPQLITQRFVDIINKVLV